jgi:stress response protein YsnF
VSLTRRPQFNIANANKVIDFENDRELQTHLVGDTLFYCFGTTLKTAGSRENYCGDVYALDVEKYHTYFANKIATHNCPIEMRIIRDLSSSLGKSLNIDYEDFTEVSQLRVMVDQEIQMIRKSHFLAEEGFIMENVIGVSDDGEAITKKELSLGVELEDRIHKRLKDYGERLIATRAARAKLNGGETDSAKVAAKIMREIATIDRERERLVQIELGDVLDAEVIED